MITATNQFRENLQKDVDQLNEAYKLVNDNIDLLVREYGSLSNQ